MIVLIQNFDQGDPVIAFKREMIFYNKLRENCPIFQAWFKLYIWPNTPWPKSHCRLELFILPIALG